MELVYTPVLGTGGATRASPSLARGTLHLKIGMEKIVITSEHVGQRLDRFLAKEFFLYSRGEIIKKIKKVEVLVDDKKVKPSHILEEANVISLENFSREKEDVKLIGNSNIPLDVIFENKDMIVLNKQAGLQVHPSSKEKINTLTNALLARYPEIVNVYDGGADAELRPGIVHRLDKDTTGVIVVARNPESFQELKKAFKDRQIEKVYLAVTKGIFKEKEGLIDKPLAKSSDYKKQVIARSNTKNTTREAQTYFKVIEEYGNHSLVELKPKTGRTHQIRVHLSSIGHPIVGDLMYSERLSKNLKINKENSVARQLLHAHRLKFVLFEKEYEFIALLPGDFENFLALIKEEAGDSGTILV